MASYILWFFLDKCTKLMRLQVPLWTLCCWGYSALALWDHSVKMSLVDSLGFINTRLYLQTFPWVELKLEAAKVEQPERPYQPVLVKPLHAHGLHHWRVRAELLWRLPGRLPRHQVVEIGVATSLIHQLLPVWGPHRRWRGGGGREGRRKRSWGGQRILCCERLRVCGGV